MYCAAADLHPLVNNTAKHGFITDALAYHPRTSLSEAREDTTYLCLYCELQASPESRNRESHVYHYQAPIFPSDLKHKFEQAQQAAKLQTPTLSSTATPEINTVPSNTNQSANNAKKKFNIVVYGIPECPQSTNRQIRAKKELENVIEALSKKKH